MYVIVYVYTMCEMCEQGKREGERGVLGNQVPRLTLLELHKQAKIIKISQYLKIINVMILTVWLISYN